MVMLHERFLRHVCLLPRWPDFDEKSPRRIDLGLLVSGIPHCRYHFIIDCAEASYTTYYQ